MKIVLIAVAGPACLWIESIEDDGRFSRLCVAAGGEYEALDRTVAMDVIEIGADTKPRPFCRIQESWAVRAVQDDATAITRKVKDAGFAVLVADLADRFSRGAAYTIARLLKGRGMTVIIIAALPFRFCDTLEMRYACARLQEIESCVDHVLSLNFDDLIEWLPPQTSFGRAIAVAGEAMANAASETLEVIGCLDGGSLRQGLAILDSRSFLQEACARLFAGDTTGGNPAGV